MQLAGQTVVLRLREGVELAVVVDCDDGDAPAVLEADDGVVGLLCHCGLCQTRACRRRRMGAEGLYVRGGLGRAPDGTES